MQLSAGAERNERARRHSFASALETNSAFGPSSALQKRLQRANEDKDMLKAAREVHEGAELSRRQHETEKMARY